MKLKLVIAGSLLLLLSGCRYLGGEDGWFRDRGDDYVDAQILPPMQIPSDLDSYTIDEMFVIPDPLLASSEVFNEEIPLPKPIETRGREGVIIQVLGDRRWIVIDATPGQVWPLIRDYWTQLEVILEYENPESGIMDTSWLEVDAIQETRHKYRVTIEPGLHSGYSEIYVLHLQNLRTDPIPIIVSWPEQSSSGSLEGQILDTISTFLADRNDVYQASTSSLLAGSIEAERKANLIQNSAGDEVLELKIDYDRAWVQIRQALDAAEVEIVTSDRDAAFFSVRFAGILDEDDEPGFIARLFTNAEDEVPETKDFTVRLVDLEGTVNVVTESEEEVEEGNELPSELLQVINENLT